MIAFVLWYFFGTREAATARTSESCVQEIKVTVKGGYDPDLIVVKHGRRYASISIAMTRRHTANG